MAIVGWVTWNHAKTEEVTLKKWEVKKHLINILASGFVAVVLGYLFDTYTNQANPYIDAFTTVYSLAATLMVTQKIVENWIYWIVIDLVSIYLYAQRDYNLTAVQYILFTVLAVFGFVAWQKAYKKQVQ